MQMLAGVGSSLPDCTFTGSYSVVNGGNCSTCGVISCASGVPAYDVLYYSYTPYPCMSGGSVVTGDVAVSIGSWYCLTTGTGSGLSCGPGSNCCSILPPAGCNN